MFNEFGAWTNLARESVEFSGGSAAVSRNVHFNNFREFGSAVADIQLRNDVAASVNGRVNYWDPDTTVEMDTTTFPANISSIEDVEDNPTWGRVDYRAHRSAQDLVASEWRDVDSAESEWVRLMLRRVGRLPETYREPLLLPVGLAIVLHNPDVKPEREIRCAVEGAREDARLEERVRAQTEQNEFLLQRNNELQAEVEDLRERLGAIEERARNELGLIKQDEEFYQVVPAPENQDNDNG